MSGHPNQQNGGLQQNRPSTSGVSASLRRSPRAGKRAPQSPRGSASSSVLPAHQQGNIPSGTDFSRFHPQQFQKNFSTNRPHLQMEMASSTESLPENWAAFSMRDSNLAGGGQSSVIQPGRGGRGAGHRAGPGGAIPSSPLGQPSSSPCHGVAQDAVMDTRLGCQVGVAPHGSRAEAEARHGGPGGSAHQQGGRGGAGGGAPRGARSGGGRAGATNARAAFGPGGEVDSGNMYVSSGAVSPWQDGLEDWELVSGNRAPSQRRQRQQQQQQQQQQPAAAAPQQRHHAAAATASTVSGALSDEGDASSPATPETMRRGDSHDRWQREGHGWNASRSGPPSRHPGRVADPSDDEAIELAAQRAAQDLRTGDPARREQVRAHLAQTLRTEQPAPQAPLSPRSAAQATASSEARQKKEQAPEGMSFAHAKFRGSMDNQAVAGGQMK
ncbi:hypothetical protein H696_05571 [Fonticula alba]|uniref:Uncharacterized protein n=1 Tax=Fonticula alba TaxID=691883 RepID=A0A058Z0Q2_FONAL|nr:hypothetical protein H696_05571 [Fonticula alba]KCV67840.1 hypothetical protein H696_05571 [Fonticula alba]|eukprot:XP_009497660.1 hypothetical protein H696_05571 [Fonticula alba]